MTETKVRLSLSVPGAQLLSEQECSKNPDKCYDTDVVSVEFTTKKGKTHKENLTIKTRKLRLAKQSINISKEAYNYMTSSDNPPTDRLAKTIYIKKVIGKGKNGKPKYQVIETTVWANNYSVNQRLNWHMARIAESLGAVGYEFEVFDD